MNQQTPRIAFAGTPSFAAQHLQALLDESYNIVAVFSQPDRPAGRGKTLQASPVKSLALEHNIPVHQPLNFNDPRQLGLLESLNLDIMIVVAYGLLLPQAVLNIPRKGCLNVHASLLPRWRGAAPIERAILAGDSKTGVCIMQMDSGLDTGDVLLKLETPLTLADNSQTLTERLLELGCQGLIQVLANISNGDLQAKEQDDTQSLYAKKLSKAEALITWSTPALDIQRQVNAFYPRSPAYCFYNNTRMRIILSEVCNEIVNKPSGSIINISPRGLKVACLNSSLLIKKIQFAGKNATLISDLLNGQPMLFSTEARFTSEEK